MALTSNADVDDLIEQLLEPYQYAHRDFIKEMILTVLRLANDETSRGDVKLLTNAFKELRHALRVFDKYESVQKVSIFGSARTQPEDPAYQGASELARKLVERGYMVITGAGGGIMEAGHGGAGRERSFGVSIRLPFEQSTNAVIEGDDKLVNFRYFFTRKLMFVKEADAVVLFPGGFGTHDEGFEVLTLLQTGKCEPMPVVFCDAPGGTYWKTWLQYVNDHLLRLKLISPEDLSLFMITDDVDEAVNEVANFHSRYHSGRYVGSDWVMRLKTTLDAATLVRLNDEFADIIAEGKIEQVGALPLEQNEPDLADLPRLVMRFNRRNYGRQRQLIDQVNSA